MGDYAILPTWPRLASTARCHCSSKQLRRMLLFYAGSDRSGISRVNQVGDYDM